MSENDPFSDKEIIRFEDGRYVGEVQGQSDTAGASSPCGVATSTRETST